ncbi:uncharacterized protein LOC135481983 [Liolophura sinensis]|uniref:uncharacterized protein LOC135481983 n=1 Tax=Liolophura sinensis TaxID=3198878 RepID=UPI003159706A
MFDNVGQTSQRRRRTKRAAVRRKSRLWPKGKVPYVIDKDMPKNTENVIKKAMAHIEEHTCIRFVRRKSKDEDYLYFINEPGCWSSIGRVKGQQKISMGDGCHFFGTVLHETVHALGFWHEQSRPDRDKYIRVLRDNIPDKYMKDFEKIKTTMTSSRGFPYDYRSVTHYSQTAFTKNGKNTIQVIGPGKRLRLKIGQRKGLSNLDIAQLNDMYKCNRRRDSNDTVCEKGWQKFRRSCYKFNVYPKSQFAAASKHCFTTGSKLVSIDSAKEDQFLKNHLKKHHSHVQIWRTGGRKIQHKFVWYNVAKKKDRPMKFSHWVKGHPGTHSTLALVRKERGKGFGWEGVWAGSEYQLPNYAYPFICEKKAKRKCFKSKHKDGRDYRGKLSHTESGITCQTWTSKWPHKHLVHVTPKTRLSDGLGVHNYCRNPSAVRRKWPWCFTTKLSSEWEYCDVTICK